MVYCLSYGFGFRLRRLAGLFLANAIDEVGVQACLTGGKKHCLTEEILIFMSGDHLIAGWIH